MKKNQKIIKLEEKMKYEYLSNTMIVKMEWIIAFISRH